MLVYLTIITTQNPDPTSVSFTSVLFNIIVYHWDLDGIYYLAVIYMYKSIPWLVCIKLAQLIIILYKQKLPTEVPRDLKLAGVTINVAKFVNTLRRHVSLKMLMGIITTFLRELLNVKHLFLFY